MEEFRIIKETATNSVKSLLTLAKGKTVSVPCQVFAPYSTVKSAVSRLNQHAGFTEFEVSTPDNGATIVVKRNVKPAKAPRQ
jgi:hypothetical protein